jgi:hypothetical protein
MATKTRKRKKPDPGPADAEDIGHRAATEAHKLGLDQSATEAPVGPTAEPGTPRPPTPRTASPSGTRRRCGW